MSRVGDSDIRTIIAEPSTISSSSSSSSTSAITLTSEGEIHESLYTLASDEYCTSGSITPDTQGNVNSIIYSEEELRALVIRLQNVIKEQAEKLGSDEENLVELMDYSRTLLEIKHIKHSNFIFEINYQKNINPTLSATSESLGPPVGPLVTRFGINPIALQKVATDEAYGISFDRLHFVEEEVLARAIEKLNNISLPSEFAEGEFAHNTVVVDILVRENGSLKMMAGKAIHETHAVVLWKPIKDRIFLIDPSKREYSEHIAKILNSKSGEKAGVSVPKIKEAIIYATQGKDPGPPSKDSDADPMPRDCIDIAVKLAFEINEQEVRARTHLGREPIEIVSIITLNTFNQISNRKLLNEALLYLDNTPIRELQSSDRKTRIETTEYLLTHMKIIQQNRKIFARASLTFIKRKIAEEEERRASSAETRGAFEATTVRTRKDKGKEKDRD
jgi:hypothetical protein